MKEFTAYLHEHIPLTAALDAEVVVFDGQSLRIRAPLTPNLNHRNTAFGGSISALTILSGWGLLHLRLKEEGLRVRLVIQKSECDFSAPVDSDFSALALAPDEADWKRFLRTLKRRGRARIPVVSQVGYRGGAAGSHTGTYVAELLEG